MTATVIDCDGHVLEDDSLAMFIHSSDAAYLANKRLSALWPSIDRHHNGIYVKSRDAFGGDTTVRAAEWQAFLNDANIKYSVLYPSFGAAIGNITSPHWAGVAARAYNDWLHQTYLRVDPRFKGIALLPMQDVAGAVSELRRAVKELGMLGAMLPANGLKQHLGDRQFWPIYDEAARLGCALSVHGGNHGNMGFDNFTRYTPINGLGHPFGQMIAFSSLVFHGVFDEFPTLRVAFLEAGSAWISLWIDRMDRSYQYHVDIDEAGRPIRLKLEQPSDYFRTGNVFVGCEGSEVSLSAQIKRVGNGLFMFASDFPHEVTARDCLREIEEIEEAPDLTTADRAAILGENAQRFYAYAGGEVTRQKLAGQT